MGLTTYGGQVLITRGLALEPAGRASAIGYLQKDFIVDGSNNLIGSTARFMVMDPDGSNPRELFPASVLGAHAATVEYWDW